MKYPFSYFTALQKNKKLWALYFTSKQFAGQSLRGSANVMKLSILLYFPTGMKLLILKKDAGKDKKKANPGEDELFFFVKQHNWVHATAVALSSIKH